MVDTDQCLMEVVEHRTSWIMPMGYEVEEEIIELYAQHLLSKPVDTFGERFETYAEKSLKFHSQFKKLEIVRKVRKEVEAYAKRIGITKEVVREVRKRNILPTEDLVKEKKAKLKVSSPKPKQTWISTPSSGSHSPASSAKPKDKSSSGEGKRKKGKKSRVYVATFDDEETKSDESDKEIKQKGTKDSKVSKDKPFDGDKPSKKPKRDSTKSGMTVKEVERVVIVQGNLIPLSEFYDKFDEASERTLEEATIIYLNKFSKALIEIITEVPKSLYDFLEFRRDSAKVEEERLREYVLVQVCHVIAVKEIDRIIKEAKTEFRNKTKVNKIMIDKLDEVMKDTETILTKFLLKNQYEVVPKKSHDDTIKSSILQA